MKIDDIKILFEIYAKHTGLAKSTISLKVANKGHFLKELNAGRTLTFRRCEKIISWFSDNWPQDLAWPATIDRPTQSTTKNEKGNK